MLNKKISFIFLFVIISFSISAKNVFLYNLYSVNPSVYIVKTNNLPVKTQLNGKIGGGLSFLLNNYFSISTSGEIHQTNDSNLDGGFLYRGFDGISGKLSIQYKRFSNDSPEWGISGGICCYFSQYLPVQQYFFYPSVFIEPFIDIAVFNNKSRTGKLQNNPCLIRFAAALEYFNRPDFYLFLSTGISITILIPVLF